MITTGQNGGEIGATIGVGDRSERKGSAPRYASLDAQPQREAREERREERRGAELGAGGDGRERLGDDGGGQVEVKLTQDREVVAGSGVRQFNTENNLLGAGGRVLNDGQQQGGPQTTQREAREQSAGQQQTWNGDD